MPIFLRQYLAKIYRVYPVLAYAGRLIFVWQGSYSLRFHMASEEKEVKDTSITLKIQTDDSVQPGLKFFLKRLTNKRGVDYFRKLQDTLCVWIGFFVFVSCLCCTWRWMATLSGEANLSASLLRKSLLEKYRICSLSFLFLSWRDFVRSETNGT